MCQFISDLNVPWECVRPPLPSFLSPTHFAKPQHSSIPTIAAGEMWERGLCPGLRWYSDTWLLWPHSQYPPSGHSSHHHDKAVDTADHPAALLPVSHPQRGQCACLHHLWRGHGPRMSLRCSGMYGVWWPCTTTDHVWCVQGEQVYSVKWYKGGLEIFRYLPSVTDQPITTFPRSGVIIDKVSHPLSFINLPQLINYQPHLYNEWKLCMRRWWYDKSDTCQTHQ